MESSPTMPTEPHLQQAFNAVEGNDHVGLSRVLPLIRDDGTLHASRKTDGFSLATLAASKGNLLILGALKGRGVDFARQDANQDTPLHAAVRSHSPTRLSVLRLIARWSQGTEGALEVPDCMGDRPLHVAVDEGELDAVKVLIDAGASVSGTTRYGDTPLHRAAWAGHVGATRALLAANASPEATNHGGETALHLALGEWETASPVASGHGAIAELLCAHGADPARRDGAGVSPLHLAAMKGGGDALRLLLAHTPDPLARDPGVLDLAIHGGMVDVMRAMVERGVKCSAYVEAPGLSTAALATAHAELMRSPRPEHQRFAGEFVCPLTGRLFALSGEGRPVQLPGTTTLTVSHAHQTDRVVTVQRGDVVRADALTTVLASHPNQSEANAFRESTAFREGDPRCIARLGAVVDVYLSGSAVERRAEEARLTAETVSGPEFARLAAQWALATLTGDRSAQVRNAAAGSPHSASTWSSSPSLSSPAL